MVAAGVNFTFYWLALRGRDRLWPQAAEVRAYLLILVAAIAIVTLGLVLSADGQGAADALRDSAFTVVSILTTTGYTTADFDQWPDFTRLMLLALMFIGGCAGSTAGGIKVIRIMLLGKAAAQELQRQLQPKAVQVLRIRGRVFSEASAAASSPSSPSTSPCSHSERSSWRPSASTRSPRCPAWQRP